MNTQKNAPRLLGAAFLLVAVVSLSSGLLLRGIKEHLRDVHAPASSLSTIPIEGTV